MENKFLLGKNVADKIKEDVKTKISELQSKGKFPTLATVRLGERADDIAYESSIVKVFDNLGIKVMTKVFDLNISQNNLEEELKSLNNDDNIHGILVFRPLPKHIDEEYICNSIDVNKDVDCISKFSLAGLFENKKDSKNPCTAQAVIEILKFYDIKLSGKNIVVLGRSNVIGKPVALLLTNENATVTICHSKSENIKTICKNADILVSSIGKARFINSDFIKDGAIVIDVGINEDENHNIVGDVDFEDVLNKVSFITPVPRGVGAVTTSVLAKNLINSIK